MTSTLEETDEVTFREDVLAAYLLKTIRTAWRSWEEQRDDPNEEQPEQDQWTWTATWLAESLTNDGPYHAYTSNEVAHMFRANEAIQAILYQATGGNRPAVTEHVDYGFGSDQVN